LSVGKPFDIGIHITVVQIAAFPGMDQRRLIVIFINPYPHLEGVILLSPGIKGTDFGYLLPGIIFLAGGQGRGCQQER
jgi:hypothetical protein